ncbi:hypothetical protein D1872_228580 [compost metagenome]
MTIDESERALVNEEMFIIPSPYSSAITSYDGFERASVNGYSSKNARQLMLEEIEELLNKYHLGFS